ncbi:uracil-DNA glycosylase family protein [Sediminibacterium ginsengisoli]|uniref:Uracil-DNA glycosylase-like domain-containing protein n=1 Tax=Sediminibacterium ginsengisoli TaxID=413434 RepID=A0A1T4MCH2_9BACT|nr:uracil-DNA glycosylase family protein [Sediminibacterium ginsengisoli]SJZ64575.1 protein of unknown function [Sediminibacterium ginsengisoli]
MPSFGEKVIRFYRRLEFREQLPAGIRVINPFEDNRETMRIMSEFYRKFYNDNEKRHLILGINPGRFGAAVTGIPFTDTSRLQDYCGISYNGKPSYETSSVFVYEMINAFGGTPHFCRHFYINSMFPLAITKSTKDGKEVNYNYYDSPELKAITRTAIIENIRKQISLGTYTDTCICFGTGKNEKVLQELNSREKFFRQIIPLEHPRYIMQYKLKQKQAYIDKYLRVFETLI